MRLTDAVHRANTPEDLAEILQQIARRYLIAKGEEKKFAVVKAEIRDACIEALKRLETDKYEWATDDKRFRASVYKIVRVKPTKALVDLLVARGMGDLVHSGEVTIDHDELFKEVRRGKIGIEEIRVASEIGTSQGFRITELKSGEPGEPGENE